MTLTKDVLGSTQIEAFRDMLIRLAYEPWQREHVDALCDLALVGLAVQPRPISEAPKDGSRLLLYSSGTGRWPATGSWYTNYWALENSLMNLGNVETFIPLSALPQGGSQNG